MFWLSLRDVSLATIFSSRSGREEAVSATSPPAGTQFTFSYCSLFGMGLYRAFIDYSGLYLGRFHFYRFPELVLRLMSVVSYPPFGISGLAVMPHHDIRHLFDMADRSGNYSHYANSALLPFVPCPDNKASLCTVLARQLHRKSASCNRQVS